MELPKSSVKKAAASKKIAEKLSLLRDLVFPGGTAAK
jgi:hypothetical protein